MHVPAWPVYPEQVSSTLEAFRSTSLAGLGFCDQSGSGEDCDGIGAGGSPAGDTQYASEWAPVLGAAIRAGTDLSKLVLIQPGTMQQGSLTSRQNPGFPVQPATQTGFGLGVKSDTGGALMIAAVVAIGAVVLISGKSR